MPENKKYDRLPWADKIALASKKRKLNRLLGLVQKVKEEIKELETKIKEDGK